MAYTINSKICGLKPYDPIQGCYRIRLDANESFLLPPSEIAKKIRDAVSAVAFNRYPDPYAEELCRAFAGYYGVEAANVVAGNGSDELISVLMNSFLMKDDGVMTVTPDFSMYRFYSGIVETKCYEFRKDGTFSVDNLADFVNEFKCRMLIFSNPCNPTSLGLKRDEVRRLIRSVDSLVVLDEAYMDFWDQSLLSEVNDYDNLVILRTCSKAAGMAGIRLGFAVANQTLVSSLKAVKSPYNVNAVTQAIGTVILREKDWLHACVHEIVASKNALFGLLRQTEMQFPGRISVVDGVTNFITVRLPDAEAAYGFLQQQGIAVRCFPGFLRITAGAAEENTEFINAFTEYLRQGTGGDRA